MPKGCQNGTKIDAQTHHKSVQKQVAESMRKLMKNSVYPMCKTMQKHCTVVKKRGLARWVCGAGKSSKHIENYVKIRPKFDGKSMWKRCSKKWCQNNGKRCQHGAQRGANIEKNMQQIHVKSNAEIWHQKGTHAGSTLEKWGGPFYYVLTPTGTIYRQ